MPREEILLNIKTVQYNMPKHIVIKFEEDEWNFFYQESEKLHWTLLNPPAHLAIYGWKPYTYVKGMGVHKNSSFI